MKSKMIDLSLFSLFFLSGCAGIETKAGFQYVPNPVLLGCVARIGAPIQCANENKSSRKPFSARSFHKESSFAAGTDKTIYSTYNKNWIRPVVMTVAVLNATQCDQSLDIYLDSLQTDATYYNAVFATGSWAEIKMNGSVIKASSASEAIGEKP